METTVNMRTDILQRISRAAALHGISRTGIIILIVKKMMKRLPDPDSAGSMVRYQADGKPDDWHAFHLRIRMDEYEYLLDLRKLFKMSVSLIIAYGVDRYLDKLMGDTGTDNNRFANYMVIREIVDTIICWKLYWGYPHNISKHIPIFQDSVP
ncbi:MAG TPA: hypothetical protein PL180_14645 [Spirochaetota bacterium]|nr:hypothetical protein [Spirochaetota bacterium]HRS79162.1 hypothetical protein [Spirochaetota bacterium]HRT77103.1 hypothetical protein [Spirochaetota bacterium]